MGELVDALVRVLEIMVQGALAASVIFYAIIWLHPVRHSIWSYISTNLRFVFGPTPGSSHTRHGIVVLVLGGLYSLGVIVNTLGYWVLEPAHEQVLVSVRSRIDNLIAEQDNKVSTRSEVPLSTLQLLRAPLRFHERTPDSFAYEEYIQHEVQWRNKDLAAMQSALDPLLKQIRVVRGAVVCALAFGAVSLLKTISHSLAFILLVLNTKLGRWLFEHSVHPKGVTRPSAQNSPDDQATEPLQTNSNIAGRYALACLLLSLIAFALYYLCMMGYKTVESEFHSMVELAVR